MSEYAGKTHALTVKGIVNRLCLFVSRLLYARVDVRAPGVPGRRLAAMGLMQKVLGFNRRVPWPVHFTSRVVRWENIRLGNRVWPGFSMGCYIQATNGIRFGNNVRIGPNAGIISANHAADDYDQVEQADPITVGSDVWIGMGAVILPGVKVGDNVVIGANSVVTADVPSDSIAAGSPCRVIRSKAPYRGRKYE